MMVFDGALTWVWVVIALAVGFILGKASPTREAREAARAAAGVNLTRLSSEARARAEAALDQRKMIEAVKIIREDLGADLRDSKLVADLIVSQRNALG